MEPATTARQRSRLYIVPTAAPLDRKVGVPLGWDGGDWKRLALASSDSYMLAGGVMGGACNGLCGDGQCIQLL